MLKNPDPAHQIQIDRRGVRYRRILAARSPLESPTEIESADVERIRDASASELLEELNEKFRKWTRWPAAAASALLFFFLADAVDAGSGPWVLALGLAVTLWVYRSDRLAKTTRLRYDFDKIMREGYGDLHRRASELGACRGLWHVPAEAGVKDPKYQAGAQSAVRRVRTFVRQAEPRHVKTNVKTIAVGVGRQTLYFFPDRVLVFDKNGVGAVAYSDLEIETAPVECVEQGKLPKDAEVVGRTWSYVNKDGGPDRRFGDNKELPLCLYEQIHFRSASGLNERIQASRVGAGERFAETVRRLAERINPDD